MSERLKVDVDALRKGGVDIDGISSLVLTICRQLGVATATYRFAGGTGERGEKFDTGYRPGEVQGMRFLALLEETIGAAGGRTIETAESFARTDEEATSSVKTS